MIHQDHINKIDKEIRRHMPNGKLKCVGFCIDVDHAIAMSKSFNEIGYHTIALTGKDSIHLVWKHLKMYKTTIMI